MELTRSLVAEKVREYEEREPFYAVEQEHVEMLPDTFAGGEYGWRDVEWVVQWYFRRHRGAYPNRDRRAAEDAFGENSYEAVHDALDAAVAADGTRETLDALTALAGVDVPVASAFLLYLSPERYVVVGPREWGALRAADELDDPYPDDPTVDDYLTYDGGCSDLRERLDVDAWTLYRALWRLSADEE